MNSKCRIYPWPRKCQPKPIMWNRLAFSARSSIKQLFFISEEKEGIFWLMVAIRYFPSQSLVSANIGLRKFLAHRQMNSAVVFSCSSVYFYSLVLLLLKVPNMKNTFISCPYFKEVGTSRIKRRNTLPPLLGLHKDIP